MEEEKVKFGFGLNDRDCFCEMFDSVQELLEYAIKAWDNEDSNIFNEDDENVILVGTINHYSPHDFAPSLGDIADQMTDKFYCDNNIDATGDVQVCKYKEAEKEYNAFIDKYFDIPASYIASWVIGAYDVKAHRWVERFSQFDNYVKDK